MVPCCSNVTINSLKAHLSLNHLFSLLHGTWISGNEPSQHQEFQCQGQITTWLIISAFQRKILIKRRKCERKIRLESVLLRWFSKMEPGGHWRHVTYAHLSLNGIWFLTTFCPNEGIQNICQKLKILIEPSPCNYLWPPSLKDKHFLSCIRAQPHGFCLYKLLTLSLPWNILSVLPKCVSPELQF